MPKINEIQYRTLFFERAAVNSESRTVDLSFSSEQIVTRYDWWGDNWNEVLGHEPGNCDMARLSEIGVLLFNHNANMPIGQVMNPRMDDKERKCTASVRFDADPESDTIFQKVQNGTLKGVSVGYRVQVWEEVKANQKSTCGRFTGPCSIARKWEPYEVSIVSVPADASVGVGRSIDAQGMREMVKPIVEEAIKARLSNNTDGEVRTEPKGSNLGHYRRKLYISTSKIK